MSDVHHFEIRREGRRWSVEEVERAYRATDENPNAPSKMEFVDGKFFHSDAQRTTMLGWMLEMMGADAAVRLGDPDVWRAAALALPPARPGLALYLAGLKLSGREPWRGGPTDDAHFADVRYGLDDLPLMVRSPKSMHSTGHR